MPRPNRPALAVLLATLALAAPALGQPGERDTSRGSARREPAWVRDAVVYEVFPRAFSASGDFKGVEARLDRIKELGVTIVWLMPIHPHGQKNKKGTIGSPYAVRDYYAIDPAYGTGDDLKRLVQAAHDRGLKVIIDIVANHTAWDSVLMDHPEFYTHDAQGKIISPVPDWSDVADLNYGSKALRSYMTAMLEYWLREYDLDGFRCDVAGEVPTDFWEAARAELEKIKPDVFLLAEASKPELMARAFDADYAWPFHAALNEVMMLGKPASALRETWTEQRRAFPRGALHLYFSDNHDERRAIARFGERGALAAAAIVLTMDGIPLIYNGQEAGDTSESGAPALFETIPIFWEIAERRPEFPRFFRQMVALRHAHPALRQGDLVWLPNSDESRIVTYLRRAEGEEFLIAINLSNRPFRGSVTVEPARAPFYEVTPVFGPAPADVRPARPSPADVAKLVMEAWGVHIFRRDLR